MDAYEQVKVIGKGSFGVVTQIVRKSDGKVRPSLCLLPAACLNDQQLMRRCLCSSRLCGRR